MNTLIQGRITGTDKRIPVTVDSTGRLQTTAAGSDAVQLGSGVNTATTQRVTLASDGPGVANLVSIANNTAGGATAGATLVNSTAYQSGRVIKASAGTLISLIGYNSKASAQFIQLFNSATVPADAAAPVLVITVAATSNFSVDVPITGMPFTTGIAVSNSSTGPAKTIGSADCYFTAVLK